MPHIIVKILTGRTAEDKQRLAERITLAVMNTVGASESSISVAVEDVEPREWCSKVYDIDISPLTGSVAQIA